MGTKVKFIQREESIIDSQVVLNENKSYTYCFTVFC